MKKVTKSDLVVGSVTKKVIALTKTFSAFISPVIQFFLLFTMGLMISQWAVMETSPRGCHHFWYQYKKD